MQFWGDSSVVSNRPLCSIQQKKARNDGLLIKIELKKTEGRFFRPVSPEVNQSKTKEASPCLWAMPGTTV